MSVDRFIAVNEAGWQRLADLTRRARRRRPDLSADEVDELVRRYQQAGTHLSHARTRYRDPALTMTLTRLVADANGVLYGRGSGSWRDIGRFFTVTFPAAVWVSRRFVVAAAVLTFLPALVVGTWLTYSDRAVESIGDDAAREAYISDDFEAYYQSSAAAAFSTQVLVNNIQVSFLAFAVGILGCVGTAYVLVQNGVAIGVAGGLFHDVGEPGKFWGLILPHGLLELSAVVIAGAAGLRLGWSIIAPGDRPRVQALAEEGRRSVVIVLGLTVAFVVAGLIEGFVTPSGLSTPARVGIGVLAEIVLVTTVVVRGRAAEAAGWTGLWGEKPRGGPAPPLTHDGGAGITVTRRE